MFHLALSHTQTGTNSFELLLITAINSFRTLYKGPCRTQREKKINELLHTTGKDNNHILLFVITRPWYVV